MKTFQDYYQTNIEPKLKQIDLFFKTNNDPLSVDIISELLDLNIDEIKQIMKTHQIITLNKTNFFIIMKEGSSEICQLFRRQVLLGFQDQYSAEAIAYIYQIPQDIIDKALMESGLHTLHEENLKDLFSYIYIES